MKNRLEKTSKATFFIDSFFLYFAQNQTKFCTWPPVCPQKIVLSFFSASLCLALRKTTPKNSRQHLECSRQLYKRNQPTQTFFVYDRADAVRGFLVVQCAGMQTRNLCLCRKHCIPSGFNRIKATTD